MFVYSRMIATLMIALILVVGCGETQPESVSVSLTATLPPPTSTPAPPTATQSETSTPTPTQTATPMPTETPTAEPTPTDTPTQAPPAIPFPDQPPELGDTLTRPMDDMVMVYVPGGTFEMGSLPDNDQFGPHAVTLDGFWIDQTEVTNAQYAAFLNDQGNQVEEGFTWMEVEQMENAQVEYVDGMFRPEAGKANHPVVEVSWNGSHAYCQWVGGRLPTEAEWEYAARGPENAVYPWGNENPTCEISQFGGCGDYSVPVGSLSDEGASWVGAKDMAGNVWEWTADYYGEYPSEAQTNPTGPDSGERKVARGGSFLSAPDSLHTAYRYTSGRTHCVPNVGFRCAASVPGATSFPLATLVPQAALSIREIVTGLQGLPLDDFLEESYDQLLLRDPERLTVLGVAESFGLRNDRLNDLSDAYIRETQELEAAILDLLRTYNRDELTPEQHVSYDVYEWYLDDLVRGHEFTYYDYPVHHYFGSYHDELVRLFTEYHPLASKQDAEDYVSRLSQVDGQVEQLLAGLRLREEAGVIPPGFIIELTKPGLHALTGGAAGNPLYTTFRERVTALGSLSEDDRQALLDAAQEEIEESVGPAFQALNAYLDHLSTVAPDDAGVWRFPSGDAYYAYILRREASVEIAPEEAHQMGLAEVERIQAELRQVFDELGYPQDASLVELVDRAARDGGFYDTQTQAGREQVVEAYEAILDELGQRLDEMVDIRPQADLVVIGDTAGGGGGYYVEGSRDGSRPGAFHAGVGGSRVSKFDMPTIAYHEANPGHHFQMAIAQELDLTTFRNDLFFNGYGEGWAMYAERLAWELGLYEDDPYGNIGRLHLELVRAARVVADTGIHAMEWTREDTYAYMRETVGDRWSFETDRYIAWPAQSVGYKIGMVKILDLRQEAMDELGDQFDIKEFHRIVLGNGSMPLDVLERVVNEYIQTKRNR
jgi:uncharacterized protein (DUF885 family)/formylglycine-generating enzyme required for sulfatase activity